MHLSLNKTTAKTFALILLLTIASSMIVAISAQTTKIGSLAFVSVSPQVSQLGTTVLINGWTSPTPLNVPMGAGTAVYYRWNYTVTLKSPSGKIITNPKGPVNGYGDGTFYFTYKPDETGNWTATLYWPGDLNFTESTSPPFTFTVQSEPVPSYPGAPLPTEYWRRPVNAENREWSVYLADWGVNGRPEDSRNYQPYGKAPVTSHILWTKMDYMGGMMGDEWTDSSYRATLTPTAIMGGRAYVNERDGYHCIDIYTGEELWATPKTIPGTLFFVTLPADPDPGGAATHSDIWSYRAAGWVEIYDASTGVLTSTKNGTNWVGVGISKYLDGYFYFLNGRNWTKWNPYNIGPTGVANGVSVMQATYKDKVMWSVNIPTGVATPSTYSGDYACSTGALSCFDLTNGNLLWNLTSRPESVYYRQNQMMGAGYYCIDTMQMTWIGYDLKTGNKAWETPPTEYPWGTFWSYNNALDTDKLYGMGYDGHVYAYDLKTGKQIWSFSSGSSNGETPYNTYAFWNGPVVADGKIYAGTTEHTPTQPRLRGNRMYCLDADTGEEIWSIAGAYVTKEIADSMLITANEYDSLMYCFGKGPTATAVSVTPGVTGNGTSVLIQGTIMDESPGQKDTPCVSMDSMSAWMEYLHMQKPIPTNATGVPVALRVMGSDGSITELGTVTSDLKGHFAYLWTPTNADTYKVIASFVGDDSYWGSWAETGLGVFSAQSSAQAETIQTDYSTMLYAILGAVAIAIIIGLVAIFLTLRKR